MPFFDFTENPEFQHFSLSARDQNCGAIWPDVIIRKNENRCVVGFSAVMVDGSLGEVVIGSGDLKIIENTTPNPLYASHRNTLDPMLYA